MASAAAARHAEMAREFLDCQRKRRRETQFVYTDVLTKKPAWVDDTPLATVSTRTSCVAEARGVKDGHEVRGFNDIIDFVTHAKVAPGVVLGQLIAHNGWDPHQCATWRGGPDAAVGAARAVPGPVRARPGTGGTAAPPPGDRPGPGRLPDLCERMSP
jgi:hypothetical protein